MHRPRRTAPALTVGLALVALAAGVAGCSNPPGSTDAFCREVRQVPSIESVLARFSEVDPDLLQDRIDRARSAYEDLAAAAPSRIDAETDQVVALVDEVLRSVEDNPSDPAKAADQLRTAMADHEGVDAARTEVAAFARTSCDVRLDPDLTEAVEPIEPVEPPGG